MTESEWQTRKQRVDTRLPSLNPTWQIMRDLEKRGPLAPCLS
jgi:hypothetical protein